MEKKFKIELSGMEVELIQQENGKFVKPDFLINLDGAYTFQPKPAVEVVIVSMKPLSEKSYTDQALKNGHGISWLDDCRIPYVNDDEKEKAMAMSDKPSIDIRSGSYVVDNGRVRGELDNVRGDYSQGRFPANLLVSDDALNDGTISTSQSGLMVYGGSVGLGEAINGHVFMSPYNDSGSNSRYFSLDNWWEAHIKKLPDEVRKVFPFLVTPKASSSERNDGVEGEKLTSERPSGVLYTDQEQAFSQEVLNQNNHPTIKPVQLMNYLITLGSRQGEIILDPFIGSGTTAISARILSRKFIGFERDEQYFKIAQARISDYMKQKKLFEVI